MKVLRKIMKALSESKDGLLISQLSEQVGMNNKTANEKLEPLIKRGYIVETKFGRIRHFKLNMKNPNTPLLLANLDKINELLEEKT